MEGKEWLDSDESWDCDNKQLCCYLLNSRVVIQLDTNNSHNNR